MVPMWCDPEVRLSRRRDIPGSVETLQELCLYRDIRARDVVDDGAKVRREGAVHYEGRSIKVMGHEPAVLSDRPTAHPDELRARRGKCRMARDFSAWSETASKATDLAGACRSWQACPPHTSQNKEIVPCRDV